MISISEKANPNYLAKVIKVEGLRKHANADRLQVLTVDFQSVITGMDTKEGDICVFFPLECAINSSFLSFTNSFRHKELNADKEQAGFFEDNCRVRAVKLRGEKSMGYIVPINQVTDFIYQDGRPSLVKATSDSSLVGQEFDTIDDVLFVKKYALPVKPQYLREGKKPRISRLVENQVRLHTDTDNLRKSAHMISPEDYITVSYKVHGTSFWVANVLVKSKLGILSRIVSKLGINVKDTHYDFVYGSRKVVKNEYETQYTQDFYGGDLWKNIMFELKGSIPKGYTLYGEALGYTDTGAPIQKGYDYGCKEGERKLVIYRITVTNADGQVVDLSSMQVKEFCEKMGLNFVHVFYHGKAGDLFDNYTVGNLNLNLHWNENFVKELERQYNEKDCFMCVNKVPEEGVVVRKEKLFGFEAYKLKSFAFLEYETKLLDEGVTNLEDNGETIDA